MPVLFQGLVQCYLDLDNVNTAVNFIDGAIQTQNEYANILTEIKVEPLWRLGRYDDLDSVLKKPELKSSTGWGMQVGRTLMTIKNG